MGLKSADGVEKCRNGVEKCRMGLKSAKGGELCKRWGIVHFGTEKCIWVMFRSIWIMFRSIWCRKVQFGQGLRGFGSSVCVMGVCACLHLGMWIIEDSLPNGKAAEAFICRTKCSSGPASTRKKSRGVVQQWSKGPFTKTPTHTHTYTTFFPIHFMVGGYPTP